MGIGNGRATSLFTALFQDAPGLLLGIEAGTGEVVAANDGVCELLGIPRADLVGTPFEAIAEVPDLDRLFEGETADETGGQVKIALRTESGERLPTALSHERVTHEGSTYVVLSGHEQARLSEEPGTGGPGPHETATESVNWAVLEEVIEEISDAAFVHDASGTFQVVNQAAVDLLGYGRETMVGADPGLFDPAVPEDNLGPRLGELKQTGSVRFRATYETAGGERVPVEITSSLLACAGGSVIVSVARDLEARRRHRRNRKLAETLFEQSKEPTFLVAVDGEEMVYERVNPAYDAAGGFDAAEVEGKTPRDVFGPSRGAELEARYRRVVENREVFDVEQELEIDGEPTHWWTRLAPIVVEDDVEYVLGTTREITDRKNREQQIETHLREAQRIANITSWYYDLRDVSSEELAAEKFLDHVHPEDRERVDSAWSTILEAGGSYDIEYRVQVGQDTRWMREKVETVGADRHGEPVEAIGVVQDITERKERELGLERYEVFLESVRDAVVVLDEDGVIRYESPSIEQILGTYPTGHVGEDGLELVHPADRERVRDAFESRLEHGGPKNPIEHRVRTADGSWTWVESRGQALPDGDEFDGLVVSSRDVSAQKERKRQLDTLISNLPGMVYRSENDPEWPLDLVRGRPKELVGYTSRELVTGAVSWGEEIIHPEDRERVWEQIRTAIEADEPFTVVYRALTRSGETRWLWEQGRPVEPVDADGTRLEGFITDVTERKERERELERREQLLEDLLGTTRELLAAESKSALVTKIVEAVENAFVEPHFGVVQFDETDGVLRTVAVSAALDQSDPSPIEPGENPAWEAFREGETRVVDADGTVWEPAAAASLERLVLVPMGNCGLLLVGVEDGNEPSAGERRWLELLGATAAAILDRLAQEKRREAADRALVTQRTRVAELRGLLNAMETIQRRFAESDTRAELEASVCEELLGTDPVDFVWNGRPQTVDTDLRPSASAGDGQGYLDVVDPGATDELCPAQQAAQNRHELNEGQISRIVPEQPWATQALTGRFKSVVAIPMEHDGVLYGVLTVFSREESAFDELYETLLNDVGSLLTTAARTATIRHADAEASTVEVEFTIEDERYQLYQLAAAADATIQFETILETRTDTVEKLLRVIEGDPEAVFEAARENAKIASVEFFGPEENGQLTVKATKPVLADGVRDHGGRVVEAVGKPSGARVRLTQEADRPIRPVISWVTTQYADLTLEARRTDRSTAGHTITTPETLLTDRQYEVLRAAYYGGYYEKPKRVTGEDLAENFGISRPAIYNHLQSAEHSLLETLFETDVMLGG